MGWRSQEQSYKFRKRMKKIHSEEGVEGFDEPITKSGRKRKVYHDGIGPERAPDEFFAQETIRDERGRVIAHAGDFNLSQVKGEQARAYFERVLKIPMPPNTITKFGGNEETEEIRRNYGIRG